MIDEESGVEPAKVAPDQYGETLLYDFSKFLTTLSLLALGGVLTITESADRSDLKMTNVAMIIIAISLAGALSITAANWIATGRSARHPVPARLHRYTSAAVALLGIGMGMFLFMWMDKLN